MGDYGCVLRQRPLRRPQLYHDYFDPFNSECRVYGRLKQDNREDLAVRAYGYLLLTADQEAEITQRIIKEGWESHEPEDANEMGHSMWNRSKDDQGRPIRAIVKELVG